MKKGKRFNTVYRALTKGWLWPALIVTLGPPLLLLFVLLIAGLSDDLFIFHVLSVTVPLLVAVVTPFLLQLHGYSKERQYRSLLYLACFLFFISWYLPSPLIDNQDTAFTTHFIGGGIFTGLVWWYLRRSIAPAMGWILELASLFALVSALGVINELAELFFAVVLRIDITLTDTNIDLFANTIGALLAYVFYRAVGTRFKS